MNNNQEFGTLRLNDFSEATPIETSPLDFVVLTMPGSITYHRGVKASKQAMDVTVERDKGLICFYGPNKAIELMFEVEELRAIMRLFDVPEDDSER